LPRFKWILEKKVYRIDSY